jgi:hypothetical protein
MKTYKINVVWQMYGSVEVEANSLEEAVKEVDNGARDYKAVHYDHGTAIAAADVGDGVSLPDNGEYIDGSFEVDVEGSALNEVD